MLVSSGVKIVMADDWDNDSIKEQQFLLNSNIDVFAPEPYFWQKYNITLYWMIFLCAVEQASFFLAELTLRYLFTSTFDVSPALLSLFSCATLVPWVLRPLFAHLSDHAPLFGSHRRAYMLLASVVTSAAWLTLFYSAEVRSSLYAVAAVAVAASFGSAILSTVIQTMMTEHMGGRVASGWLTVQSYHQLVFVLALGFWALSGGSMLRLMGPEAVFPLLAAAPLLLVVASLMGGESEHVILTNQWEALQNLSFRGASSSSSSSSSSSAYTTAATPEEEEDGLAPAGRSFAAFGLLRPALFLCLFACAPNLQVLCFYSYRSLLAVSPQFFSLAGLASVAGGWLMIGCYRRWVSLASPRFFLAGVVLLAAALTALPLLVLQSNSNIILLITEQLPVSLEVIAALSLSVGGLVSELGQLPFWSILSRVAPQKGVPLSVMTWLAGVLSLSQLVGYALSALLCQVLSISATDLSHVSWLVLASCGFYLLPLLFIPVLLPAEEWEPKLLPEEEAEAGAICL